MNRLIIPQRNLQVDYPSSWDEIRGSDAPRIGEIMHMTYKGKINYDMARKLCVDQFLSRKNDPSKPLFNADSLDYWANESRLADSVDFLFSHNTQKDPKDPDKVTQTVSIDPMFCTNLIPRVKTFWHTYYGPMDLLQDLTIFEFKEASWRVGKYAQTQNDTYLDEIFVILYRLDRHKNKERNLEKELKHGVKMAKKIDIGTKFMVYLFFLGCMNYIKTQPIEIDGSEVDFSCLFPKAPKGESSDKSPGDNTGMTGILFTMAESGVFGNMEQTSRVSMWDVFLRLYQIHHQIKSMKQ